MDNLLFQQCCKKVCDTSHIKKGIGTLGEKTLHVILKNYFEPHEQNHEVKIGGFVADIVGENGIIEIQTASFDKLRKKLGAFLEAGRVTVVYPIAKNKWLSWIDMDSGKTTNPRKSPKAGKPSQILPELYKIMQYLNNINLSICIVALSIQEYRYLNGWSNYKKKGSTRCDRIPTDIIEEIYINNANDYQKLIPESLNTNFTFKDFKKESGLAQRACWGALKVLQNVGAVEICEKSGKAFVYRRTII